MWNSCLNILCVLLFLIPCSCEREKEKTLDYIQIPQKTIFIGHKGSGPISQFHNGKWFENGRESVLNALNCLDGSEIDIQMSSDSTLWLFHDHNILTCDSLQINISQLNDDKISEYNNCFYNGQLITLKQFSELLQDKGLTNKIISLDLKVLSNPYIADRWENEKLQRFIVSKVDNDLVCKKIILEIPFEYKMTQINNNSGFDIYYVLYNVNEVKELDCNLSVRYDLLESIPNAEYNIQTWTPNNAQDLIESLKYKPEFVQLDNIPLGAFFKQLKENKNGLTVEENAELEIKSPDEYIKLYDSNRLPDEPTLFSIIWDHKETREDQFIVLSILDSNREVQNYTAHEIKNDTTYFFVNSIKENTKELSYSIYVWNKVKDTLEANGKIKRLNIFRSEDL